MIEYILLALALSILVYVYVYKRKILKREWIWFDKKFNPLKKH